MESNTVDLTKPIEPIKDAFWQDINVEYLPNVAEYIGRVTIHPEKVHVVAFRFDNYVATRQIRDEYIYKYIRNIRTLAERCREELQGATEVRVWGEDVVDQGAVCKYYKNDIGVNMVITGVFYDNEFPAYQDGTLDRTYSAYITPVTWTPEEAAQLAEELGL